MRTIAIINQKGGCGKTTTSINLAAVLALKGLRTLLVDMDPQSHCALGLAVPDTQIERSTSDLLRHGLDGTLSIEDVTWQISRGLDLIPSDMSLAMMEQQLATAPDKDRRLVQVLAAAQSKYDFCIIDCPPSIGLLTFNALRAADEVLIPVETGYFAMQGSVRQEQTIEMLVRRVGHRVRFKVLPTMYDVRTKLAREILAELKKHFGERLLPLVINFNSKLKEAASFGQPITEYDAASRGMQDFEALANWLLTNPPEAAVTFEPQVEVEAPLQAAAGALQPANTHGTMPQVVVNVGSNSLMRPEPVSATTSTSHPRPNAALASNAHTGSNPAMSRAAELVERARALSQRTADLAARLRDDPDHSTLQPPPAPQPRVDHLTQAKPADTLAQHLMHTPTPGSVTKPVMAPATTLAEPGMVAGPAVSAAVHPMATLNPTTPVTVAALNANNGPRALMPMAEPPRFQSPAAGESLEEKLSKLYGVRNTHRGVLFVQPGTSPGADGASSPGHDPSAKLAIAGDFNNWNPAQTPMTRDENLGVWRACVNVPPGRYRYRLVRNGQWVQDPFNKTVEANPFGELNNIIEIAAT